MQLFGDGDICLTDVDRFGQIERPLQFTALIKSGVVRTFLCIGFTNFLEHFAKALRVARFSEPGNSPVPSIICEPLDDFLPHGVFLLSQNKFGDLFLTISSPALLPVAVIRIVQTRIPGSSWWPLAYLVTTLAIRRRGPMRLREVPSCRLQLLLTLAQSREKLHFYFPTRSILFRPHQELTVERTVSIMHTLR